MTGEDFGEGETSVWLRPSQLGVGFDPIGGALTSIEGGGGRENVCRADVVTESDSESYTPFGVGVEDCDRERAATNARASLDSSRLRMPMADNIHWGFSAG